MIMFSWLDLETISTCNRVCPTCIRNSHPNKEKVASFFKPNYLPVDVIEEAVKQVKDMGFAGGVRLSHYNEPLMDERLPDIAALVQSYGYGVYMNTNGDFMNEDLAQRLDGVFTEIIVSYYMDEPTKSKRAEWVRSLFKKTRIESIIQADHIATHFSPSFDVARLAEQHKGNPCVEPQIRVIINHRRQYLLCCDDVVGNFNLGTFPETSIQDYWFGKKHTMLADKLKENGGRGIHKYCLSCPRA